MERLGLSGQEAWDAALDPWTAPKPKRMRWKTYERIVEAAEAAANERVMALMPRMERLFQWVEMGMAQRRSH